jgi:thiamine biosynthesis lipoprotein
MSAPAKFTRRRALRVVAALGGLGFAGAGLRALAPAPRLYRWQGEVMGAPAEIALWGANENLSRAMFRKVESEIARLHRIVSLADANSEISRLNREGVISGASPELRELITLARNLGDLSDGAFDITVQPLWRMYEARFWSRADDAPDFEARARDLAHALVDYREISLDGADIAFARKNMAITLNGVAQGFVTDRVADLLRGEGFDAAFVDLGEMRALGRHPDGRPWRVAMREPSGGLGAREVELDNGALAVSGGYGTTFEPTGRHHHLFDPATGASASAFLDVAVLAPRATIADGLSTAIYVAGPERAARLLAAYPGARALARDAGRMERVL